MGSTYWVKLTTQSDNIKKYENMCFIILGQTDHLNYHKSMLNFHLWEVNPQSDNIKNMKTCVSSYWVKLTTDKL